jgi:diguanylate cyclase (GGDEF)-like protein/PAS domain S-box-containing protein
VPDSTGLDTYLRARALLPDVPAIVQSGVNEEEIAYAAVREGAQDYLVKGTITGPLLVRAIRYALERKRAERALRASEERYALAIQGSHDGIWDWDLAASTLEVSSRFREILGGWRGGPEQWLERVHPEDVDAFTRAIVVHTRGDTPYLHAEVRMRHRERGWRWVQVRGEAVRDEVGQATRMAGSLSDITARREMEDQLRRDAQTDRLTALPNRAWLQAQLEAALERGEHDAIALLLIDLDRFKVVNDGLGHMVGDRLLERVAARLRAAVGDDASVGRFGGDEFFALCAGVQARATAEVVGERVVQALDEPFELDGQRVRVPASVGLAVPPAGVDAPLELLRRADMAMLAAKRRGGGRVARWKHTLSSPSTMRIELEHELRDALEHGELEVHYQPIVELKTRVVRGAEALLRWTSPTHGRVSPAVFVPIAEETGLIQPIGRFVIRRALADLAEHDAHSPGARPLDLAVNISTRQLFDDALVRTVAEALRDSGVEPHRLTLEITESAILEHGEETQNTLAALKELGVDIHLDDFGTGFSSLAYLQRLPIDRLKIDRSFVDGVVDSEHDRAIVEAIVGLGRNLGKGVVAEGIETEAQREALLALRCDLGQGFLFARAQPTWADVVRQGAAQPPARAAA